MHAKSSIERKTETFLGFDIRCSFHFNILDSFTHILSLFILIFLPIVAKSVMIAPHINVELSYFLLFALLLWQHGYIATI